MLVFSHFDQVFDIFQILCVFEMIKLHPVKIEENRFDSIVFKFPKLSSFIQPLNRYDKIDFLNNFFKAKQDLYEIFYQYAVYVLTSGLSSISPSTILP